MQAAVFFFFFVCVERCQSIVYFDDVSFFIIDGMKTERKNLEAHASFCAEIQLEKRN